MTKSMHLYDLYIIETTLSDDDEDSYSTVILISTEEKEIEEAIQKLKKDLDEDFCYDYELDEEHKDDSGFGRRIYYVTKHGTRRFFIDVYGVAISMDTAKTIARRLLQ